MTIKAGILFQYFTTRAENASSLKTAWQLQYSVGVPSQASLEWAEEEISRAQFNYTFESFEGQDEVNSELSAFQREEVELAKPFLVWLLTSRVARRYRLSSSGNLLPTRTRGVTLLYSQHPLNCRTLFKINRFNY